MEEVVYPAGESPHFLFFTGGTALRALSRHLACVSASSIHVVTTFDSGGSTAELRRCFAMPAMGDLRNRLLALAAPDLSPKILEFMQMRLPKDASSGTLFSTLSGLADLSHPFWADLTPEAASILASHLFWILEKLPRHFDLRGASVGNLILASVYLQNGRDFTPTLEFMNRLLKVRGRVLPVVDESLHLGCILEDGSCVLGQHKFKSLSCPVRSIFLTVHDPEHPEKFSQKDICRPRLSAVARSWLRLADAVCYPMGSFFSSVLVNLLVRGVGTTLAKLSCPRIFIPNLGSDPELGSMPLLRQVDTLLALMREEVPTAPATDFLNYVVVDRKAGEYMGRVGEEDALRLKEKGIRLLDLPLTCDPLHHDPERVLAALYHCLLLWEREKGRL